MPKRKIPASLLPPDAEAAALAAMQEALKHPRTLSVDEERDFLKRRAHGAIERHEYAVRRRGDKFEFHEGHFDEAGKLRSNVPGPWTSQPPFYRDMLKRRRDFEAERTKALRGPTMRARNLEGQAKKAGESPRPAVAAKHEAIKKALQSGAPVPGHTQRVAKAAKVSERTVQRVKRKSKSDKNRR